MLIQHRTLPSGGKIVSDVTMLLALTSCESNKKKLKEEEKEERERRSVNMSVARKLWTTCQTFEIRSYPYLLTYHTLLAAYNTHDTHWQTPAAAGKLKDRRQRRQRRGPLQRMRSHFASLFSSCLRMSAFLPVSLYLCPFYFSYFIFFFFVQELSCLHCHYRQLIPNPILRFFCV